MRATVYLFLVFLASCASWSVVTDTPVVPTSATQEEIVIPPAEVAPEHQTLPEIVRMGEIHMAVDKVVALEQDVTPVELELTNSNVEQLLKFRDHVMAAMKVYEVRRSDVSFEDLEQLGDEMVGKKLLPTRKRLRASYSTWVEAAEHATNLLASEFRQSNRFVLSPEQEVELASEVKRLVAALSKARMQTSARENFYEFIRVESERVATVKESDEEWLGIQHVLVKLQIQDGEEWLRTHH